MKSLGNLQIKNARNGMIAGKHNKKKASAMKTTVLAKVKKRPNNCNRSPRITKGTITAYIAHLFSIVSIFAKIPRKSPTNVLSDQKAAGALFTWWNYSCLAVLAYLTPKYSYKGLRPIIAKAIAENTIINGHRMRIKMSPKKFLQGFGFSPLPKKTIAPQGTINGQ